MSQNSFIVNGVQCSAKDEGDELMIDLRHAGFLENSIPQELLDHPKIKKILLFHKSVPKILETSVDKLGRSLSIEVFDECSDDNPSKKYQFSKYLWKTCQIESNQHGIIRLDIRCDALSRELVFSSSKNKVRQLTQRNYRSAVLHRRNKVINDGSEELVIACREPGEDITVNVGKSYDGTKKIKRFPEISFQGITVETCDDKVTELQDSSEGSPVSLEEMTNLKRFLLFANGKKMLPIGMGRLHNLHDLFIFDNPIRDQFQSLYIASKLQKLIIFNCGLKNFPSAIYQLKDLEVLELYFNDFHDQALSLCKFTKLKRLIICSCNLNNYPVDIEDCITLEYLDLGDNKNLGENPFSISQLKNLKTLKMRRSGLKKAPDGLENCTSLEELDLSDNGSLSKNPFSITQLKNLKKLSIISCNVSKAPHGLENCTSLKELDLSGNWNLGENSFSITQLKNLKKLHISNCDLKKVPDGLENCTSLEELDLSGNRSLGEDPFSISKLKNLKRLNIHDCDLKNAPDRLENCTSLEELDLSGNNSLAESPFTISQLKNLKKLHLSGCDLNKAPHGLANCTSLEELDLSNNNNLRWNLFSISQLKNLKKLRIISCNVKKAPDGLENCTSLKELDLSYNRSLGKNPFSISQLRNLEKLSILSCDLKKAPDGLENCTSLKELGLSDNTSLGKNPFSIPRLKNLEKLSIIRCDVKKAPDGLEHCTSLKELDLSYNSSLGKNSFLIPQLKNLKRLNINDCDLKNAPDGLANCSSLEELDLSRNSSLGENPFTIPQLKKLKKLNISHCGLKKTPHGLGDCISLEELNLDANSLSENQFSIPHLKNLKRLFLSSSDLKKAPDGLENCTSLEVLDLRNNNSLCENLFSIPQLKNLKRLNILSCGLKKAPDGLENCTSLEVLDLSYNNSLCENPFLIPQLKNLKILNILDCGLKKAPDGLGNCTSLETLDLSHNNKLGEENHVLPMLKKLRSLNVCNCGLNFVPNVVCDLPNIEYLDMSSNKLKELPERFTNLIEKNVHFDLKYNKLGKPPQVICDNGNAILKYFESIAKYGEAHSRRLRMIVLGNTNAGKTSLVNGLLMQKEGLTGKEERTEGIEIRKWYPDPENKDLELEIWDFGGHMEYQSVSHYFLEEHSLFLLVVDVSEYQTSHESYHENAGKWIDELKSIVLQPVVMIAATKSDLVGSSVVVYDRCQHMLTNISEQEKLDMISIDSDLEKLVENDNSNTGRKEKLNLMKEKRPVLPKSLISTSDDDHEIEISADEKTFIVATSACSTSILIQLMDVLLHTGSDTELFPHLRTNLPLLWVEIEGLLPTLREEMESRVGPNYLTFHELEYWFCQHLQMFNQTLDRKETLETVIAYLVKLGKVLRFERVKQLKDFIFPDPQWLIMLVKEVVHHDLKLHLKFKEDFKAFNMDMEKFKNEKQDLIDNGVLSELMLRCIWFHAVPEKADFEKLIPLLYHFDVGYKMTVKEAGLKGKEIGKNFILIPALMPEAVPADIEDVWPATAPEDVFETKSVYKFCSTFPVGLFERQMVRCHHGTDYMLHWKEGFFGVTNCEDLEEVKFFVTKEKDTIEFTGRIRSINQINTLWKVVLHFHQIFAYMVQELWPELRYGIYNKCPECNEFEHGMDFEMLLEAPHIYSRNVFCKRTGRRHHVKVENQLVFPPQGKFLDRWH